MRASSELKIPIVAYSSFGELDVIGSNDLDEHAIRTRREGLAAARDHLRDRQATFFHCGSGQLHRSDCCSMLISPACSQVLLQWGLQAGAIAVLPKSAHKERILENIAWSLKEPPSSLSEDDMRALAALDADKHFAWNPAIVR